MSGTDRERAGEKQIVERAITAARAADAKKGGDIVVLEVGGVLAITDYFVIASAGNQRQVKAVIDEIERVVLVNCGIKPRAVEGLSARRWVLLAAGDFVVAVCLGEERPYYSLERLYSDVPAIDWREDPARSAPVARG